MDKKKGLLDGTVESGIGLYRFCIQLNPAPMDPVLMEFRLRQILNLCAFNAFAVIFFIGYNRNPPEINEIYWSLKIR